MTLARAVARRRRLIAHLADGDVDAIRAEVHCRFVDARERLVRSLEAIGFWEGADHSASA